MAGFFAGQYSRTTVQRSRLRMQRTGKVDAATLHRRTTGDVFGITQEYSYSYLYPVDGSSGLAGDGFPNRTAQAVLWQEGETYAPRQDDQLTIEGELWLIQTVKTRQNATDGHAIHDLTLTDDFATGA